MSVIIRARHIHVVKLNGTVCATVDDAAAVLRAAVAFHHPSSTELLPLKGKPLVARFLAWGGNGPYVCADLEQQIRP